MIFCKNCGYEGSYISKICPVCKEELIFGENDIFEIRKNISEAKENKEIETVLEGYHILADLGDTEGEKEWARLLERGSGVAQNIDEAMDFYRRAAEKFDAESAYKYSDLVSRINEQTSGFWLQFSALLGYPGAYLEAAKSYITEGESEFANHYAYLAALCDEIDAIVFLADRYYKGEGIEKSPEYAKWYMERLSFPPLHAFKLSMRLRSVKAAEAPSLSIKDKRAIAINLLGKAKRLRLPHPIFYLTAFLFERGDSEAGAELGEMLLSGYGTRANVEESIRCLSRAAASGSARAYMSLGNIYYEGKYTERNIRLAIDSLEKAAALGKSEATELLGDIYHNAEYEVRSIPKALDYYKKAAENGSESAKAKADKIISIRAEFYKRALLAREKSSEEYFKSCYAAAAMGHPKARLLLAYAYAKGIGTKKRRPYAFSLYKAAADDDIDEAYLPLGLCYAYGIGIKFDFDLAVKSLCIADKRGAEGARDEVVRLLENKKRRIAKKLYSKAMRLIYKGKFDCAARYLDGAVKLSLPGAMYTLGCLYEFGRGARQDRDEAYRLYALADANGFNDAHKKHKLTILRMLKK